MRLSITQNFKHGEVWLANLNPNNGAEPGKTCPVFILQNQALLDAKHPTTLVIPLTTQLIDDVSPLRIRVRATHKLKKDSDLLIDQLRAIDNHRLTKGPLLQCGPRILSQIYDAVSEVLGYPRD